MNATDAKEWARTEGIFGLDFRPIPGHEIEEWRKSLWRTREEVAERPNYLKSYPSQRELGARYGLSHSGFQEWEQLHVGPVWSAILRLHREEGVPFQVQKGSIEDLHMLIRFVGTKKQCAQELGTTYNQIYIWEQQGEIPSLVGYGTLVTILVEKLNLRNSLVAYEGAPMTPVKGVEISDYHKKRIVRLTKKGVLQKEIADKVGCSVETVRRYIKEAGVRPINCGSAIPEDKIKMIVRLSNRGVAQEEIAERLDVGYATVQRYVLEHDATPFKTGRKTPIERIRKMVALTVLTDKSQTQIASELDISRTTVRKYLKRYREGDSELGIPFEKLQEILLLSEEGLPQTQISEQVGLDRSTVRKYVKNYSI